MLMPFVFFFLSTQGVHFCSKSYEFDHNDIVILIFHKAGFICKRNTDVNCVIIRVKSVSITFHVVHIVIFYVIYKAICVGIHNFRYFTKQRCHVFVKFVQTRFWYIENAHTHIYWFVDLRLEFTQFYRDQILREDVSELWKFDLAIIVSALYLPSYFVRRRTSMRSHIHDFAKYRVIHKFV